MNAVVVNPPIPVFHSYEINHKTQIVKGWIIALIYAEGQRTTATVVWEDGLIDAGNYLTDMVVDRNQWP